MRYEVQTDGTLANGRVFVDLTGAPGDDAIDGLKVDQQGNLYVSGPGGLWIISPEGKLLGTLKGPEHPHNMAWGDDDGRTLYLAAETGIYRTRLKVPGHRPWSSWAPGEPAAPRGGRNWMMRALVALRRDASRRVLPVS